MRKRAQLSRKGLQAPSPEGSARRSQRRLNARFENGSHCRPELEVEGAVSKRKEFEVPYMQKNAPPGQSLTVVRGDCMLRRGVEL